MLVYTHIQFIYVNLYIIGNGSNEAPSTDPAITNTSPKNDEVPSATPNVQENQFLECNSSDINDGKEII